METKDISNNPDKRVKISAIITMTLLLISFLWIFYDIYAYQEIKAKAPNIEAVSKGIAIGFIPKGLLYISFAVLLLSALKFFKRFQFLGVLCIIFGIISSISLVGDLAALSDIGDDYLVAGHKCILEWTWLYIGLIFHFIFYIIGLITIIKIFNEIKSFDNSKGSIINEVLFEITQYIGIVCGLAGIVFTLFTFFIIGNAKPVECNWLIWLLLGYCLIILLPYMLVIFYWILKLTGNKTRSIYDEKQKQDLARAGLTSWLFSIPVMLIFLIVNLGRLGLASTVLWFPLYIFFNLFLFSLATLIYFKKDS